MDGRVDEGAALERQLAGKGYVGSNPTPSARNRQSNLLRLVLGIGELAERTNVTVPKTVPDE